MPKFLITRTMAASHTLTVGVEAVDAEMALTHVLAAHNDGCIRDDFVLLEDYYDHERTQLGFNAVKTDAFPKPGREVAHEDRHAKMMELCERLDNREYVQARTLALQVLHDAAPDVQGMFDDRRDATPSGWRCEVLGENGETLRVQMRSGDSMQYTRPFESAGCDVVDHAGTTVASTESVSWAALLAAALNQYFELNCDALQNPHKNDRPLDAGEGAP